VQVKAAVDFKLTVLHGQHLAAHLYSHRCSAVLGAGGTSPLLRSLSTDQTKPARSSELAVSPTAALARQALLAGGCEERFHSEGVPDALTSLTDDQLDQLRPGCWTSMATCTIRAALGTGWHLLVPVLKQRLN